MSRRCVSESWLRLERYHLAEVDDPERAGIAEHLARCSACAATYASLAQDDAVALPPLPARRLEPACNRQSPGRLGFVVTGLALAAALALGVGHGWQRGGTRVEEGTAARDTRVKGDAVAFTLVCDDDERIEEAGGVFRQGDRFKAIVSCPPSMDATFDLVVYDATGASFPLTPARVTCANEVPLSGAFRLSGSTEEKVCLVWAVGVDVERATLSVGPPTERSICKSLTAGTR